MNIFEEIASEWRHHTHHPSAPAAPTPATIKTGTGGTMTIATIEDDVREDLTKGLDYVAGWAQRVQQALPGIVSTVDTVSGSTIGKLASSLAGAVIPEPYESMLVSLVSDFASRYGQPATTPAAAATTTTTPVTPAAPATATTAPAA